MFFVNDRTKLFASTAPSGIAAFALGPDVTTDGSILRFVFPGDDDHQASIAIQRLHVEPPTERIEEPDELAQGTVELPLLVLSLPKLAPRLWDLPQHRQSNNCLPTWKYLLSSPRHASENPGTQPEVGAGADFRPGSQVQAPDWQHTGGSEAAISTNSSLVVAPDALAATIALPQPQDGANGNTNASSNDRVNSRTNDTANIGAIPQQMVQGIDHAAAVGGRAARAGIPCLSPRRPCTSPAASV